MKKMSFNNDKCLICDGPMGLVAKINTKFGECYICKDCAAKIYNKLGSCLTPRSPKNLFKTKEFNN